MRRSTTATAAAVLAALWLAAAGAAQVTRTQDGRALDASSRIGSRGVNTPVAGPRRLDSQLYVNGQVTGLGRFRGRVGYYPSDSLRLRLPSSSLTRFRQQSTNLESALGGESFRASPYYSRTSTVFGPAGIAAGRTAPGSSIPRTSSGRSPLARKLYAEAQGDYAPLAPVRVQPLGPIDAGPGLRLLDTTRIDAGRGLAGFQFGGLARPGAVDLFARHRPSEPRLSLPHAYTLRRSEAGKAARGKRKPPPAEPEQPFPGARRPTGADAATTPDLPGPLTPSRSRPDRAPEPDTPPLRKGATRLPGKAAGSPGARRSAAARSLAGDQPAGERLPRPNEDVFIDLLVTLKHKRGGRVPGRTAKTRLPAGPKPIPVLGRPAAEEPGRFPFPIRRPKKASGSPTTQPSDRSLSDWATGRRRLKYPEPGAASAETPTGRPKYIELAQDRKILIHRLAGRGRDQFNQRMASAHEKLRAGRFYDAVSEYELASALDPGNPLASLGAALALFFAGEPMTSATYLRQAMQQFPPLMEVWLNLPNMVEPRIIRLQLERLQKRLSKDTGDPEPMMLFLATYLHLSAGQDLRARTYARGLHKSAGPDPLLRAYADYVLTGKRPARRKKAPSGQ